MARNVVVLGPPGAGKSTIAARLSAAMRLPYRSIDMERAETACRFGYSEQRAERLFSTGGAVAFVTYTGRFDHALLRSWLQEGPAVIDTSGGLVMDSEDLKRLSATDEHDWVLVWPGRHDDSFWHDRLDGRADAGDWWRSGGADVQRAAVAASAELAADPGRIMVISDSGEPAELPRSTTR